MYLKNLEVAEYFSGTTVKPASSAGQALDPDFLGVLTAPEKAIVYLESSNLIGNDDGLEIVVFKDDIELAAFSFPLETFDVADMYKFKDFRYLIRGGNDTSRVDDSSRPFCMDQTDKTLVWLHGYNVDVDNAEGTFAEVFKRFFHSGYNGGFTGVSWDGNLPAFLTSDFPGVAPAHYHQSVLNAIYTAKPFAEYINGLQGSVDVAAHSLGNMVIGEAIQKYSLNFDKYFAIDASVALEAYGATTENSSMMNFNDANETNWQDYWNYSVDSQKVLASKWYERFVNDNPEDNRKLLTWRNRLDKVTQTNKIYNFYSSTEEVLREYTDDDIYWDGAGSWNEFSWYSWAKQEKFKGRMSALNIGDNLGGVASSIIGWSYNDYYSMLAYDALNAPYHRRYTPLEASMIDPEDLKLTPFFDLGDPALNNLVQTVDNISPSAFVKKMVSETELTNCYTDNQAIHSKIEVLDWLLAEAFPATTLPMGANKNGTILNNDGNIDMSSKFKTSETDWPRDGSIDVNNGDWWHGDYKDIPYQHNYEFYKTITGLIK